ncbi:MAG: endopeptidase La [Lentisphaeria bacterium]|nr:endopeptidase La [Lentisphaeria bacterium]
MAEEINISLKDGKNAPPATAALLELHGQVVYPYSIAPVVVHGGVNLISGDKALNSNRIVAAFSEMPSEEELRSCPDVYGEFETFAIREKVYCRIGTLCRIVKKLKFPDGTTRLLLRGISRIRMIRITNEEGVNVVHYEKCDEKKYKEPDLIEALEKSTIKVFQDYAMMVSSVSEEFKIAVLNVNSPSRVADIIAEALMLAYPEKIMMLSKVSAEERLYAASSFINRNMQVMQTGAKIQNDVHLAMSKAQKEYFLNEQLKAIKKELGEDNRNPDIIDIEKRMAAIRLPEAALNTVKKELSRIEVLPQMSPEYHVLYNYIDTILSLPWDKFTDDRLDVAEAAKVLDEDHYGLKDVKERILEFLSVLKLNPDRKAPILCLVGPPGVGKTSLGQSIARALNRKFIRMALGGVRDEAEIRGHRRTYIGAMPGRILQSLKKCGSSNPLFLLDEIDKINRDFRGDPASALLEVLDSAQNSTFSDHYLELEYDLSKVFFVATANTLDTIPAPLLDRMEIIRLPGYTAFEKREIAKQYLVPRELKDNGLDKFNVKFNVSAINEIIDYYTRESGVRELDRVISRTCRKVARNVVENKYENNNKISVKAATVNELLGSRKYLIECSEKRTEIGTALGMAWTSVGGTTLTIESVMVPGKGNLKLTGSLGKVMQESAEAAFTYIKSRAADWGIEAEVFEKNDFHIHVPDGATPKDGPSAGITITSALYSLLTKKRLKSHLSMTGEINLRGRVTIIGGVKEKVIAALRAGVRDIILPLENKKDLEEIPEEVSSNLNFHFVKNFDEALKIIF